MKILSKLISGKWINERVSLLRNPFLGALVIMGSLSHIHADNTKIFVQATQGVSGFAGIVTKEDGNIAVAANPKNLRVFNPSSGFISSLTYTYTNYSFMDDFALIPVSPGVIGGLAGASFLDGRVPTLLNDGKTIVQSNQGVYLPVPSTGLYNADFNPDLLGIDPITYRKSNGLIYAGSSFNPAQLFKLKWQGSAPVAINLDTQIGANAFQFSPINDYLYSPDLFGSQIVQIVIDDVNNTGAVTPVVGNIPYPVALKINSKGTLYFLSRTTGNLYSYDFTSSIPQTLATFPQPLDNLCLSLDETKIYVSNNDNGLFQYNLTTGTSQTLFSSPITQPWDLAYDPETASVYIADTTGVKQFKASNGKLMRSFVFDSINFNNGALIGFGNANGITVEGGPDAKIIITDGTIGDVVVLNKSDFSVYDFFNAFVDNTGLAEQQPFSTVRVVSDDGSDGTPAEYYLATDTIQGSILKFYRNSDGSVTNTVWFSGLLGPIKLKLHDDYVYIVEGGDLNNFSTNTGQVSRIPLIDNPTSADQEILVSGRDSLQGLDIQEDYMFIVEGGTQNNVLQAASHEPSIPTIVYSGLKLGNFTVISQFNPYPVYPFAGLAVDDKGKTLYVNQTNPVNILSIKLKR